VGHLREGTHDPPVAGSSPARPLGTLELTEIVYTSGPPTGRGTDDEPGARPRSCSTACDHPPRPGSLRQRCGDVPVLRDLPPGLRRMAPPVRSGWGRGAAGSFPQTPREPHATKAEIVGKIIYLRRSYHDIAISPSGVVADSDIGVVLPDVTGHRPHHLFAIPTRGQDRTHRKNCLGRSGKGQRHRLDRPAQAGC
jgi:hypothetical protein